MLITGFILAGISVAGCYLVYRKFPVRVRGWMNRHPLFTDLAAAITTYILFAGTVTGLVAAAWAGIMVSLMLALTSNPTTNALLEGISDRLSALKERLIQFLSKYAPTKQPKLEVVK